MSNLAYLHLRSGELKKRATFLNKPVPWTAKTLIQQLMEDYVHQSGHVGKRHH